MDRLPAMEISPKIQHCIISFCAVVTHHLESLLNWANQIKILYIPLHNFITRKGGSVAVPDEKGQKLKAVTPCHIEPFIHGILPLLSVCMWETKLGLAIINTQPGKESPYSKIKSYKEKLTFSNLVSKCYFK